MNEQLHSISVSRYYTATSCLEKYHLKYMEGIRGTKSTDSMTIGSLTHEMISVGWLALINRGFFILSPEGAKLPVINRLYTQAEKIEIVDRAVGVFMDEKVSDLFEELKKTVGTEAYDIVREDVIEQANLVKQCYNMTMHLFTEYLTYYVPVVLVVDANTVMPLVEYEIDDKDTGFQGIVDFVGYNTQSNTIDLIDWKIRRSFTTYSDALLDPQLRCYAHLLKEFVRIDRMIQYQVKSKPPQKPEILKNGKVSRKRIVTTVELYTNAIIEAGESVEDYADVFSTWVGTDWVSPVILPSNSEINESVYHHVVSRTKSLHEEALTLKSSDDRQNLGYGCRMCEYKLICETRMLGGDVNDVKKNEFELAPWYHESDEDEIDS